MIEINKTYDFMEGVWKGRKNQIKLDKCKIPPEEDTIKLLSPSNWMILKIKDRRDEMLKVKILAGKFDPY